MNVFVVARLFLAIAIGIVFFEEGAVVQDDVLGHVRAFKIGLRSLGHDAFPRIGKTGELVSIVEHPDFGPVHADVFFIGRILIHDGVNDGLFGDLFFKEGPVRAVGEFLFDGFQGTRDGIRTAPGLEVDGGGVAVE